MDKLPVVSTPQLRCDKTWRPGAIHHQVGRRAALCGQERLAKGTTVNCAVASTVTRRELYHVERLRNASTLLCVTASTVGLMTSGKPCKSQGLNLHHAWRCLGCDGPASHFLNISGLQGQAACTVVSSPAMYSSICKTNLNLVSLPSNKLPSPNKL